MRSPRLLLGPLLALTIVTALAAPAATAAPAAAPAPTTLHVDKPPRGYADTKAPLSIALAAADSTPLADAPVTVERKDGGSWDEVADVTTDETGAVTVTVERARTANANRLRVTYPGDAEHAAAQRTFELTLRPRATHVLLTGPVTVPLGKPVTLKMAWRTATGEPVAGRIRLLRRVGAGGWEPAATLYTGADGVVRFRTRPTDSTRWRALVDGTAWTRGAQSTVHTVTVTPPQPPVDLPAGAPTPRVHVPTQPPGTGRGAHPVTTLIPNGIWNQMTGISWHEGCPVGRSGLRLLRINYWGYDGYRHRGELVAAAGAIGGMRRALTAMYRSGLPLRSLYRVDRFGYSPQLRGGNDYRSMAAGNTSAFNCRWVTNKPGVVSPHSYGRAIDLNTWENPYRSATGLVPNSWWQGHSHPRVAWRSGDHEVVRALRSRGFSWTYGLGDTQHFDYRGGAQRIALDPRCRDVVCD